MKVKKSKVTKMLAYKIGGKPHQAILKAVKEDTTSVRAPKYGYHGTDLKSLKKILKSGVIKSSKNKSFTALKRDLELYNKGRGKSVFFSTTFKEAESWAYDKAEDETRAVIKVKFPPKTEVYEDDTESSYTSFYYIGKIPKTWFAEIKVKEPMGSWIDYKKVLENKEKKNTLEVDLKSAKKSNAKLFKEIKRLFKKNQPKWDTDMGIVKDFSILAKIGSKYNRKPDSFWENPTKALPALNELKEVASKVFKKKHSEKVKTEMNPEIRKIVKSLLRTAKMNYSHVSGTANIEFLFSNHKEVKSAVEAACLIRKNKFKKAYKVLKASDLEGSNDVENFVWKFLKKNSK